MNKRTLVITVLSILALLGVLLFATRSTTPTPASADTILVDGSSTLSPLTEAAAETFGSANIVLDISGTGGGFKRFCAGETDIQNASRPIKPEEADTCAAQQVEWYEIEIAFDGITLITRHDNTWLSCLTTDELEQLWRPDSTIVFWSDLNPTYPRTAVNLYGPGADSGTFDYFTQTIVGTLGSSRTDYTPSEDDHVIIEGVAEDEFALGYVGYSYAHENADRVKILAVDSGTGCVTPSYGTINTGEYSPLSRPLYLYVNANSIPKVGAFLQYFVANLTPLIGDVGLIPAPAEDTADLVQHIDNIIAGAVAPDSKR